MDPESFAAFTRAVTENLAADPEVLGVVALGSAADRGRPPDEWSDHDLWVVTLAEAAERFRTDLDWLPAPSAIVLAVRETEHGVKALYESGHLVEFAVFAPDQLAVTKANDYRVLLDREDIAARMEQRRAATIAWAADRLREPSFLLGQFLTNLLVGVARHWRGERLSGHDFVKTQAVAHLVALFSQSADAASGILDDIDPTRRFETAFPDAGDRLGRALCRDVPAAAADLLALASDRFGALPDYPHAAHEVVRRFVGAER